MKVTSKNNNIKQKEKCYSWVSSTKKKEKQNSIILSDRSTRQTPSIMYASKLQKRRNTFSTLYMKPRQRTQT